MAWPVALNPTELNLPDRMSQVLQFRTIDLLEDEPDALEEYQDIKDEIWAGRSARADKDCYKPYRHHH